MLKDNPEYKVAIISQVHGLSLYMPAQLSAYHTSRYVAAGAQNIYSSAGATKEVLQSILKQVKAWCNDANQSTASLRTDIGTMMDNLLYRMQYPVDELCAIRMGAIFCFMEDEDPNDTKDFWTQRKVAMAIGNADQKIKPDPDLYAFFLTMGIEFTPAYRELSSILTDTDYLSRRQEMIQSLTPERYRTG